MGYFVDLHTIIVCLFKFLVWGHMLRYSDKSLQGFFAAASNLHLLRINNMQKPTVVNYGEAKSTITYVIWNEIPMIILQIGFTLYFFNMLTIIVSSRKNNNSETQILFKIAFPTCFNMSSRKLIYHWIDHNYLIMHLIRIVAKICEKFRLKTSSSVVPWSIRGPS